MILLAPRAARWEWWFIPGFCPFLLGFFFVFCIPFALAISSKRVVNFFKLLPSYIEGLYHLRSDIYCPPMLPPPSEVLGASVIICSKNRLKSVGDNTQPCPNPTDVVCKDCAFGMLIEWPEYIHNVWTDVVFSIMNLKASCQTRSNTFLKSMKLW